MTFCVWHAVCLITVQLGGLDQEQERHMKHSIKAAAIGALAAFAFSAQAAMVTQWS